ncbi:hypothetical protein J2X01_003728 [Arthrobacter ginsengisoli]|uniref:Uncharacterized protein n=1 Tax=Arthrobacter ginsengisoli TaxID=1356565 RepID=A0ABU1UGT5_9MICC|nr:hypothetical protein [Arthrobacter ginsengisoli]
MLSELATMQLTVTQMARLGEEAIHTDVGTEPSKP